MTEAPAYSATADVVITKGPTPAGDRARLSRPDGTVRHAVVRIIDDLPHLAVESAFGLEAGLWGALSRGEPPREHAIAEAAVEAVVNRWGEGPDTPDGIRDRMRGHSPEAADLADGLGDETIRAAATAVRRLYRQWRSLPPGGTLRLTWPLPA
ncbi:MAG: hypothetical protein J2P26_00015 [Nocardiopsaceae bacterium]|nr:hypothetical protein [Nocardiopsaceae bacterium]